MRPPIGRLVHQPAIATLAVIVLTGASSAEWLPPSPAIDDPPTVVIHNVPGKFDRTRAAVADAKRTSGRDYRVVVVDNAGEAGSAAALLEAIITQWRSGADAATTGFNPAADVTMVIDVDDRQIAMDVPWSLEASAGLDRATLEKDLIATTFVPRAKDRMVDEGIADLVLATEAWVRDRNDAKAHRAEARRRFTTKTLPLGLATLGAAGVLVMLLVQWTRHGMRLRQAREKLAAFKGDVVALSDLLDAQRERHRMLPHTDPDFATPMEGMTRTAYDGVQAAIGRYRERWLSLMDVWERAQEKVEAEWFLGTAAANEAIALLDSAEARPPLANVAAECRAPLDALEHAHETARETATSLDAAIAHASGRLEGLGRRGRSDAAFKATLAEVTRGRSLFGDRIESDPIAARGGLEQATASMDALLGRLDALESADDRRKAAATTIESIRQRVVRRRADGWLLTEPGADPDERLDVAEAQIELAAQLLDAGETDTAISHVERAEHAAAETSALLENIAAARAKAQDLLPSLFARTEALAERRRLAAVAHDRLASHHGPSAWSDVAENLMRADDASTRVVTLLDEARRALAPEIQHDLRAVATLEEAARQEAWMEACLAAIVDRVNELDALKAALPGRQEATARRVVSLQQRLTNERTDRISANERCREAARLLESAGSSLGGPRPDLRQVSALVDAADAAVARGEELADEDARLARQAANDIDETDSLVRRVAAWYDEGVQADVRSASTAVDAATSLLARQRYEDAIRTAAEASRQARLAYATATAEADRRRLERQRELQRRQMEESFSRTSRGTGPWVVRLPGGTVTGPHPWHSTTATHRPAGGGWSPDIAQVNW